MLQPNESKGNDNFLEKFFQEYGALKKSEEWGKIINLGLQALKDSEITNVYSALIQCRLTSCYYYLGQHQEALEIAKDALEKATKAENKELQARSFYLISAIYRVLALKTSGEQQKEYKEFANSNTEKALELLSEPNISNFTKAKVHFNAGALEHDLNSSFDSEAFDSALKHYSEAQKLFKAIGSNDDYDRTAIRYLRAAMEEGKKSLDEIEAEAGDLSIKKETKTGVQFSILMSRVLLKNGKVGEAFQFATNALEVAKGKSMKTEVTMLEEIISKEQERGVSSSLSKVGISKESEKQHVVG
ncbi:hypothetical protein [Wolbachia endosymbiont (group E) of Neria commutata]|uniref:hypothetical protein n=1 Tax=Wolbachia endosymbiont (group E) of Neria commutata TaxID=3066149 RepID=UPI0031331664